MIKHLFTLGFICICMIANAQVGVGTTDPKATLEVRKSTTTPTTAIDGIIAPNITKLELASKVGATYGIAQTGAIVYITTINTVASEPSVTQVANINTIGYYYFDGTVWQSLKPVEPWNLANSSTSATSNTQNIYQSGRIGLNSATIAGNTDYFKTHDAVRAIEIIGDGNESDDILIRSFSSAGSATGQLFQQASRGTAASPAPVQNGDGVGTLTFAANGAASGVAFVEAANIKAVVGPTGTISSTSVPMDLAFSTGIANNPTETMRISSAGNVGIKTTTPNATLDIVGAPTVTTTLDGVIPPRITGDQLKAKTYTAAQNGALVYATVQVTTSVSTDQTVNVNIPGLYYFDGPSLKWIYLGSNPIMTNFRAQTVQALNETAFTDQIITFIPGNSVVNSATTFNDTNDEFTVLYDGSYQLSAFIGFNANQPNLATARDYIAVNLKIQISTTAVPAWTDATGIRSTFVGIAAGVGTAIQVPSTILELKASDKLRFVIQRPDLTIGSDSKANSPFGVFPPGNGHINRPIGQNYTKSLTILKVR